MSSLQSVVVLDNIRSLYNVGSIIRTADAFGIGEVFVCGYTPSPKDARLWKRQQSDPDAMIKKTALKGLQTVKWSQEETAETAVRKLKEAGYFCVAVEQHPSSIHASKRFQAPIAIVIGNELDGVSPETLKLCDQIIEIPMRGAGKSLNVAIAFGIVCHSLL